MRVREWGRDGDININPDLFNIEILAGFLLFVSGVAKGRIIANGIINEKEHGQIYQIRDFPETLGIIESL